MKIFLSFWVFLQFSSYYVFGQILPSFGNISPKSVSKFLFICYYLILEGYTCTTRDKNVSGLCKKRSDCLEELAGQKINICGYTDDQEPVVCCTNSTRLCVQSINCKLFLWP